MSGIGTPNQSSSTTIGAVTAKIQDSAGNALTSTGNKLDVNASIDTTGLATSVKQSDGSQKTQIVDSSGNVIGSTTNALDINIKSGNPTSIQANAGTNLNTSALAVETGGNLATVAGAVSASKMNVNISSGSIANTSFASTIADGADVTLGAKADAKSTATDTTAVSIMSVLKEISAMEQSPASRAVTNVGTFAVQSTNQANSGVDIGDVTINNSTGAAAVNIQDGGNTITVDNGGTFATQSAITAASGSISSGAIASGAIASGALSAGSIAVGAIAAGDTSIATTEDTARAGGEHLVKIGLSRLDTPVANANVSNDGDYTNFTADNFGKQWVTGTVPEDTAHVAGEALSVTGSRRIDTLATSAGSSGDWATTNQTAEGAAWATLAPTTTSGLSIGNFTSGDSFTALTNSAQVIKASAGLFYGYYIYNPNTAATYVEVYNVAAASVTVGTTNPLLVFCIPASSGANLALPYGLTFDTAMSIAATTTGGGNTAPTTALEAMVWFK